MILATALLCLSLNLYHEARGEPLDGQHAVAQVTLNRANHDPKKVCSVVTQRRQFSWTTGAVKKVNGHLVLNRNFEPKDKKAWNLAVTVAKLNMAGWMPDVTGGYSKFYAVRSLHPAWAKSMKVARVIGNHRFYKEA